VNLTTKKVSAIPFGAEPRANLMPPEVRAAERARASLKIVAFAAVIAVVVMGGAFAATAIRASQAQSGLIAAQQATLAISTQKAKYTEATTLSDLVATVTLARVYGVSSEVLWSTYYNAITAVLPAGVSLTSVVMAGEKPWADPTSGTAAVDPLAKPGVASIAFVVSSASVLDQTALTRSMSTLKGFTGSSISQLTLNKGVYSASVSVGLSSAALSGRFAPATTSAAKK
jgi:hypothetical protein